MKTLLFLLLSVWTVALPHTDTNGYGPEEEYTNEKGYIYKISEPRIVMYHPDTEQPTPVVLVCPGGSYVFVSGQNEGFHVAQYLNRYGIAVAVLHYRLPNAHPYIPLQDAATALQMLRDSAPVWNLQTKIGVMGFSAGGHLAASLVTKYPDLKARPDYGILVYPVISSDPNIWHRGTFEQLLGAKASKQDYAQWSLDKAVTPLTPPCYIVVSEDDKTVPMENSMRMYQSLRDNKVPAEMIIVPEGGHGWGFARTVPQRDLINMSLVQYIFRQSGYQKEADIVRLYEEDIQYNNRHKDYFCFWRYHHQNDSILSNQLPVKAVFLGNSITQNWGDWRPEFFRLHHCAPRGISGQTSAEMLVRMQSDVIALHPEMVFILAGTNDVACNSGVISDTHFLQNVQSMCELASLHGIRPIICSILPHDSIPWHKDLGSITERILRLNGMLQAYAQSKGYDYIDFHSAMRAEDGSMREGLSDDGVHPYAESYSIMEALVEPYLR